MLQAEGSVTVENYCLPQFSRRRNITTSFHMFVKCPKDKYDFILGCDLLKDLGLIIDYSASKFMWDDIIVDIVPNGHWTQSRITNIVNSWNDNTKPKYRHDDNEMHITQILPADYKPTNITEVVNQQTHLTADERDQLQRTLFDFQDLFQGKRGEFIGKPIELELLPGSKPFYGKPFSIPKAYQQITKDEVARLKSIGLFTKVVSSKLAAPTFIIPKKNNNVRGITDFRGLNKCLKCAPYLMPKIPNIFRGMEKFRYAMTIDLNMVIIQCL